MILFPYASRANLPRAEARAVTGSGHVALFVKEGCHRVTPWPVSFRQPGHPLMCKWLAAGRMTCAS